MKNQSTRPRRERRAHTNCIRSHSPGRSAKLLRLSLDARLYGRQGKLTVSAVKREFPAAALFHIFDYGTKLELRYLPSRRGAMLREWVQWLDQGRNG